MIRSSTEFSKKKKKPFYKKILLALTSPLGGISRELEDFIENLALLVDSGLDIVSSLHAVRFDTRTPQVLEIIDSVIDDIDSGYPLWRSLDRNKVVQSYLVTFVRIGEESGQLPENLALVVEQIKKNRMFRSKLLSAMLYPAIILGLSLVLGLGIFIFVIPRLSAVYSALNIEMPVITSLLIGLGDFLSQYGIIVVPLIFVFVILLYRFLFVREKSKHIGQKMIFAIKPLRIIVTNIEVARMGFLLGTLLKAGLPILDAVNSLVKSSDFYHYRNFYLHLAMRIEDGYSFADTFKSYSGIGKIIPLPVQQILIAAERSGNFVHSLEQIGERFEDRIDTSSKNLSVLLEPVMLIAVWLGVVFVALSVILPVYNLVGGVGQARYTSATNTSTTTPVPTMQIFRQITIKDEFRTIELYNQPDGNVIETISEERTLLYEGKSNGWYLIVNTSGKPRGWVEEIYIEDNSGS